MIESCREVRAKRAALFLMGRHFAQAEELTEAEDRLLPGPYDLGDLGGRGIGCAWASSPHRGRLELEIARPIPQVFLEEN